MNPSEPDVKRRILLAAKKLFAKQGFDGTSVRQICDEASANVALISYYFGGKEKVLWAIFEQFFPANEEAFLRHNEDLQDPVKGLGLMIRGIVQFTMNDKELSDIVQQELMIDSPRTEVMLTFLSPVWSRVKELLETGKEQGVFQFESIASTLLMVFGIALSHKRITHFQQVFGEVPKVPEEYAEHVVEFIYQGLLAKPVKLL